MSHDKKLTRIKFLSIPICFNPQCIAFLLFSVFLSTFVPAVYAQEVTEVELSSGILDRDKQLGKRWMRVNFSAPTSGIHTIRVTWDSNADIRFTLFQVLDAPAPNDRVALARNNQDEWTGTLSSSEQYYLGIWSASGSAQFTATLETEIPDPLAISAQPTDLTITESDNAAFSVTATGTGTLSYQWFANGTLITDATESTLTLGAVALSESGTGFAVQVSDTNGSITSDAATLTVEPALTPTITTHPADLTITEGDSATFSVTATGTGTLSYQWLANGTPITDATESTLTIGIVALSESGTEFAVQVSDTGGSITSDAATLTVEPAVTLTITTHPEDLTIAEGDSATFSVTTTGTGTLIYQWLTNGTPITDATESTLTLGPVALSESGTEFAVQVSDTGGSITSDAATLTVEPAVTLTITTHPEDLTIAEGDSATFSVTTTGTGTLIYQWLANGTPITDATESTLTLSTVALGENATEFAVQVSDTGESITSDTATLTVDPVPVPLAISAQPSDLTIVEGNNATFSVTATGTGTLSYQWLANGIPITDATESTLTLSAVALSESGTEFAVQVSDNGESMTSDTATLQVTEAVSPVTVMTLGQGTLDSDKNDGPRFVRLHFEVFASVEHTISVTWDSDADLRFNILRADGSRLNPTTIRGSNPGVWVGELDANEQYNIGLWSVNGSANYTATVSASIPLTIQNQPSNVVVSEGQDARFSVAAVGSSAITYQWFADENPIPGEIEDTLTVFATTLSENGSGYRVEVSDGADTITSDVATLSVREPTTFGPYSQASDTSTWMLNGPAPTLDFNVSVANAAWGRVLLRIGDILLVGGDFTGIRQNRGSQITDRPWLAAFNAVSGQPESSFQVPPQIDSVVRALTLSPSGSEVYVGGDFGFLVLDAVTGELNNSVSVDDGQAVGRVFDIAVTQTQLYIGGDFTHVDNTFRKNVARLSLDGQLDETWNPRINTGISTGREAPVQAVTVSPSGATVYLGGSFRDIDDTAVPLSNQGTTVSMLALDASEGASVQPERFTPNVTLRIEKPVKVHDILVTDDYVIVAWGGPNYLTFHALDGTRLRQYQATGDVQALKIAGNQLFVGHHGEYFGDILSPIPQESIQSIDPEIVTPFKIHSFRIDDPTFPPEQSWSIRGTFGVWGISVAEDSLWVAGQIVRAGSNGREVDGLARFPALE